MSEPSSALIHFYRASVAHADVWRQRMDTTTNWAVITNAAIISFGLSTPSAPHFVVLMVILIDVFFLVMESRRYQVYDLWYHRIRILQRYVFAEALAGEALSSDEARRRNLRELADHLGHTVSRISLLDAMGFRIRRNYFYIMLFAVGAWFLKLDLHPDQPETLGNIIYRAHMGPFDGPTIIACVLAMMGAALFLAIRAPSEQLVDWSQQPSPLKRMMGFRLSHRAATSDEMANMPSSSVGDPGEPSNSEEADSDEISADGAEDK